MIEFIWGFLGSVIGAAIGVPVLAFVCKTVVDHWLSRHLARFNDQLQSAREKELAELQSALHVVTHQQETRFAKWHDRQATTLAGLYSRLVHAEARLRPTLPDFQPGPVDEAWKAREELRNYFEKNRVFVPEQIEEEADYVLNRLSQVLLRVSSDRGIDAEEQEVMSEVLGSEIPRIRENIRQQIRAILI